MKKKDPLIYHGIVMVVSKNAGFVDKGINMNELIRGLSSVVNRILSVSLLIRQMYGTLFKTTPSFHYHLLFFNLSIIFAGLGNYM